MDAARSVQPVVAVEDPGGNICDTLDNIVVQVKIKENTGNATLLGNQTALTVLGIAEFVDLELNFRGEDYVLEYNTTAGPMKVREVVDVAYSTEFMVRVCSWWCHRFASCCASLLDKAMTFWRRRWTPRMPFQMMNLGKLWMCSTTSLLLAAAPMTDLSGKCRRSQLPVRSRMLQRFRLR